MLFEVISAGFGGQGILFLGDTIAEAALREGKHVSFLPTYGVAMRGGTANCVVTVSDETIGSPVLDHPDGAVIMNEPSLVKFQSIVRSGGIIVANSSLIDQNTFNRDGDVRIVWVPATEMAREVAGTERSANMVALGAFLSTEPLVEIESVRAIIRNVAGAHKQALVEKNLRALQAGFDAVKN